MLAVAGGVATIAQLASTGPAVWLLVVAGSFATPGLVYLAWPFFRPVPNPSNPALPARVNRLEASVAIIAVIAVVMMSAIGGRQLLPARESAATAAPAVASPASVFTLDTPRDQDQISSPLVIGGAAANLLPGESIWVWSRLKTDSYLHLHPGPCTTDSASRWHCNEWWVGEDGDAWGTDYEIVAARVKSDVAEQLSLVWREIDQPGTPEEKAERYSHTAFLVLPTGTSGVQKVEVTRR
jgi:hypothetical protein